MSASSEPASCPASCSSSSSSCLRARTMHLCVLLPPFCYLIDSRRSRSHSFPEGGLSRLTVARHTKDIPSTKNDLKSVSAAESVSQYKDEPFTVSAGKLFQLPCVSERGWLHSTACTTLFCDSRTHFLIAEVIIQGTNKKPL